jgi:hypothetical protein
MRLVGSNTAGIATRSNRLGPKVTAPVGRIGKTKGFLDKVVRGYDKAKPFIRKGIELAQANSDVIDKYGGKHASTIHSVVNMADKATKAIEGATGH